MRRLLFLGLGAAVLLACGVGPAIADNGPHVRNPAGAGFDLIAGSSGCANCHREHSALVKSPLAASRDDLCLTCHGHSAGGATTNVIDGVRYGDRGTQGGDTAVAPAALRGGGFDYALIGSGAATKEVYRQGASTLARNQNIPVLAVGQVTTSKHLVSAATDTAWNLSALNPDAGAAATMECISCHDPHGNGSYRNLRPFPGVTGDPVSTAGVIVPDAGAKTYDTTNYWLSGDADTAPVSSAVNGVTAVRDGFSATIVQWCSRCHLRNHFDATIEMKGTTCITCHVAHGSNATLGGTKAHPVTLADGSPVPSRGHLLRVDTSRAICAMCHAR